MNNLVGNIDELLKFVYNKDKSYAVVRSGSDYYLIMFNNMYGTLSIKAEIEKAEDRNGMILAHVPNYNSGELNFKYGSNDNGVSLTVKKLNDIFDCMIEDIVKNEMNKEKN